MSNSASNDDLHAELIKDFIIESVEGLDLFDQEILAFESEANLDIMNVIFRVIHTIKGTAGCLALSNIESLSHAGENLLSLIRDGKIETNKEMITSLLELSDALRSLLQTLETTGDDTGTDNTKLLNDLKNHQKETTPAPPEEDLGFGFFDDEEEDSDVISNEQKNETIPLESELPQSVDEPILEVPLEEASQASETSATQSSVAAPSIAESSIRIGVAQLDKVMNMVGELVLARNQIVLNTTNFDEAALLTASQRLNIITTELQENVMKTRMQPIGNIWAKFPRVVRDVSTELGKEVRLVMDGQDTELDRTIIEAIKDPLTHIVRNSIDHGIESPEKRAEAGKAKEGFLSLRAYHEGGQIIIEIIDDGAGIDTNKVKEKAISKSLITQGQASNLSEKEAINLVFLPGFSTADKVSNVSGRGVGMDVVRTNIEKTGGSVDISSDRGNGTTIKIKIPLTLAIIPALTVTTGGDRYAIPQVSLLELVRLEGEQATEKIEELYGAPIYRLRGQLLPLVYLNEQLKSAPTGTTSEAVADEDLVVNIIVLQADGRQFGLVVDQINDTEEIVVKPLSKQLKGISCFAGATIMGDGKVALILDVLGIAQHARVINETLERTISSTEEIETEQKENGQTLLLFTIGENNRIAIPLSKASRLEEFSSEQIEYSGNQPVVQYRGEILPLIRVADYLANPQNSLEEKKSDSLQVIVYSNNGYSCGLIVDQIQDIIDENVTISRKSDSPAIQGSIVVQDQVTDLLDAEAIIAMHKANSTSNAVLSTPIQ